MTPTKKHKRLTVGKRGDGFVPRKLVERRPDLCPEILRLAPAKAEPFDVSYISQTAKTITIRHRDGRILTLKKTRMPDVLLKLLRDKHGNFKRWAANAQTPTAELARRIAKERGIRLPKRTVKKALGGSDSAAVDTAAGGR